MNPASFATRVAEELSKARAKHKDIKCAHEAYAVILEELDEVWDEVKQQKWGPEALLKELVQVGAMAQRAAEDLNLIPKANP